MVVNMCNFYGKGRQNACKKEAVYFCILFLITKCMRAEIKRDEKLLIDLEGPNLSLVKLRSLGFNDCIVNWVKTT